MKERTEPGLDLGRRRLLRGAGALALASALGCRTSRGAAAGPPDLTTASASELAAALRRRIVGAAELCRAHVERIERLDPRINAVVVRDFERALAAARAADEALARGDRRPLLGVPVTVKESFDLEGHATTFGLEQHRAHRAGEDAEVVRRLRRAGAVVLGKTNVSAGLRDWQAVNPVYGRTSNPYDLSRTSGGSSGGGAAALAARLTALEVGSDVGGSLRVPAAFCGVFALKPSYGAVPLRGHAPGGTLRAPRDMLVAGPMARTAEDLALLLGVLAGPDGETASTALDLPPPRAARLAGFRVLVLDHHPAAALAAELREAIAEVEAGLRRAGATVARESEKLPPLEAIQQAARKMGRARGPDLETTTLRQWFDLLEEQYALRRRFAGLFEDFDAIVTAAWGTTAFPHLDEPDFQARSLRIDGEDTPYGAQVAWSTLASLAQLPAAVAPVGLSREGLPIAVQVIGPFLGDLTAVHLAGLVARELPVPALAR